MSILRAEPHSHSGKTNVWLTPRWVLNLFGPFDLDPCAAPGWETAAKHYYEADNGLYCEWDGFVWCNPPYGVEGSHWVTMMCAHGNGLLLVANRSDSSWWQTAARRADAAWFPRGRIHFLTPDGFTEVKGTAFASVIFAFGAEAVSRLSRAKHLGTIMAELKRQAEEEAKRKAEGESA